ncbi:MAG: hypothetical protein LBR20_00410, partial [Propionibacteriaceae bacterium]|nr:hypothetical protein [Propionibacteriaceae bacterium]
MLPLQSNAHKRCITLTIGIALLLGLLGYPAATPAYATDAAGLVTALNGWSGGGSGTLAAVANGDTVTVTGTVTNATSTLTMAINSEVTVDWKASLSSQSSYYAISVSGAGTFRLSSGSVTIAGTSGSCYGVSVNATTVVLSGDARISVTGCAYSYGISLDGGADLTMNGGEVQVQGTAASYGIHQGSIEGAYSGIFNGGKITASGSGYVAAIYAEDGWAFPSPDLEPLDGASLTITGGEYHANLVSPSSTSSYACVVCALWPYTRERTVTVSGGVFTATGHKLNPFTITSIPTPDATTAIHLWHTKLHVTGGTLNAAAGDTALSVVNDIGEEIRISGGDFVGGTRVLYRRANPDPLSCEVSGSTIIRAQAGDTSLVDEGCTIESGIVYSGNAATVHGDTTLDDDFTIANGETLTIPANATLSIPAGTTLKVDAGGTLINNGTLVNNGLLVVDGTLQNNSAFSGT